MEKIRDTKQRTGKFFVNDILMDKYGYYLGVYTIGVYVSLCRHYNVHTGTCFPSKELIAKELHICPRTVYDSIKKLEDFNMIQVDFQGRKPDGKYKNKLYKLLDKSEWRDPMSFYTVGTKEHYPWANKDKIHEHHMPNKDTHSKDTNSNESVEKTEETIKKASIKDFKPLFLLEAEMAQEVQTQPKL